MDDSPGDPTENGSTKGEGGDCSGFTFKSWYERIPTTDGGFTYSYRMRNEHGPYLAANFKSGFGQPHDTLAKSSAIMMDAFASDNHVGMIYTANTAFNTRT